MAPDIRDTPGRAAYFRLLRASDRLLGEFDELFRAHGLTHTQFNALRILLQGSDDGVPCQAIGEQLIHRVPDVTRIVDRMEQAGWVRRDRSVEDRRVVLVRATAAGRRLAESLYPEVDRLHRRQMKPLSAAEVKSLGALLGALMGDR